MIAIPFRINLDTDVFRDKFPELQTGAFIRNISLNNNNYMLKIMPNFFTENIDISLYDSNNDPVVLNISFRVNDYTNYLLGGADLSKYTMTYNFTKKQFEIN